MVLRRGGESLVTTDGRRAASRRVVVSCDVLIILELEDDDDDGIALPVGRTNALQLVAAAMSSTADKSLQEIITVINW